MHELGLGAGLAALAFWGFLASIVVAGIWYAARERESQHETVRRLVESGRPIDQELMDKLLRLGGGERLRVDRTFQVTALWLLPVSVGIALFGLILGAHVPPAQAPLLGAAALCACLGVGCLVGARITRSWYPADTSSPREHPGT